MSTLYSQPSLLSSGKRVASHWKLAAAVFGAMFSFIAVVTFLLPNRYQSRAKILVNNSRMSPMVSLDQQTQGVLYVDEVSESRINTEIELLTSADVLRQVVQNCHLADLVKRSIVGQKTREDIALQRLEKDLSVLAVRKSNVIQISYQAADPVRAAQVVASLANVYLEAHVKLQGSPGTADFFQKIADQYAEDLQTAEMRLAEFRADHHIVALPEEKSLALQQSAELEKSLAASSAATRKAQQEANHLQSAVSSLPQTVQKEQRSVPNQTSIEQLSVLLLSLKNKRTEALQRYLPQDRIVQELDVQIGDTEGALQKAQSGSAQEITTGSNPTWLSAEDQYLRASADYAANRAQTETIGEQVQANRSRLMLLEKATVAYQDLERQTKQLQELEDFYDKKSEEAKVNDRLDVERISNVSIAETPFPAQLPASPKRGLILSLGFLWSLLLGVATAFVADLMREHVSAPYELEEIAGLPLLAFVPQAAIAPSFGGSFPAVYMSMQRTLGEPLRSHE